MFTVYNFYMDFRTFHAAEDDDGRRLDRVARKFIPETNLSRIYKALRKGFIKLNGKKSKPDERVRSGDEIQAADFLLNPQCPEKSETEKEPPEKKTSQAREKTGNSSDTSETGEKRESLENTNLKIVFQNQNLLFIEKPYGITVHGKENSLDKAVKDFYRKTAETSSLSFSPGPLHRLDERTTGLLAFSWSLQGAKWFSENLKNHSIRKEYIAVVQGKLCSPQAWKDFIGPKNKVKTQAGHKPEHKKEKKHNSLHEKRSQAFRKVRISSEKKSEEYKEAITEVFPLSFGKTGGTFFTLVKFTIKTGRTHQIRAQSAFHGFPLLGDSAYGGKKIAESAWKREFFLHAFTLSFPGNRMSLPEKIECPLGEDFLEFLKTNNCGTENMRL